MMISDNNTLGHVRSFVIAFLLMVAVSSFDVSASTAGAAATAATTTATTTPQKKLSYFTKEGYGVDVYECDTSLSELPKDNRQKKMPGSTYRVCFRPNQAAINDNVGIEHVDGWTWDTTYDGGVAEMEAVKNGKGDGILSDIQCKPDKSICRLDSMFPSNFHKNPGTVVGEGKVTLTNGKGSVLTHKDLFQAEFKFVMPELPEQKIQEYMEMYKAAKEAEAAAAAATDSADTDESTATSEESKEDSIKEEEPKGSNVVDGNSDEL